MNLYNLFCVLTTLCSTRMTASTTPSTIIFPEDETAQNLEFPLDLARMLNNVTDIDELMHFMEESSRPIDIVSARFGSYLERKATARMAKMATCTPEETTVSLKPSDADVATYYYPPCTRVKRCGGCCTHDLLSCQPTEVEILQLSVVISEFKGGQQLVYRSRQTISVEQHKKCQCDCRVKESDCNPYQTYRKEECKCVCKNKDKKEKCHQEAPLKLWNSKTCQCLCREELECTSGYYFDEFNTCQCVPERPRRVNTSEWDRLSYNVD